VLASRSLKLAQRGKLGLTKRQQSRGHKLQDTNKRPTYRVVTMLARVAACAALFFAWSLCAEIYGRTPPFPGLAVAAAQEMAQEQVITAQNVDTERKTQAAPRQDTSIAGSSAGAEPASANQAVSSQIALAPEAAPFGLATERVYDGEILRKWTEVESEIREDKRILARCRNDPSSCPLAAQRFLAIVDEGRVRGGRARVGVINRAINLAIISTSDLVQWGVVDRWSAPLETFTTGRGDCEDYAIAKYVALRAAGVAPEEIKLVVVRNTDISENHAVVAVRLDGAWVILDNRSLALVPDREMWRATPVFEIDEGGVRQFLTPIANAGLQEGGRGAVSTTVPARR
jgi:predicted transglutaminase-like cysteine proteinase